jgi:hypothetical protein
MAWSILEFVKHTMEYNRAPGLNKATPGPVCISLMSAKILAWHSMMLRYFYPTPGHSRT